MSRTLRKNITLDAGDGNYTTLEAGTDESDLTEAQRKMLKDNPKAWAGDNDEEDFEDLVAAASSTSVADRGAPSDAEVDDEFSDMTVPELREYAEANNVDLGDATKKVDIQRVLRSAR